jgi:hypothetical protein
MPKRKGLNLLNDFGIEWVGLVKKGEIFDQNVEECVYKYSTAETLSPQRLSILPNRETAIGQKLQACG